MIDCIFILLIFFIVTTVFVEEPGVEIFKPDATVDSDLEKNSNSEKAPPSARLAGISDRGVSNLKLLWDIASTTDPSPDCSPARDQSLRVDTLIFFAPAFLTSLQTSEKNPCSARPSA